MVMLSLLSLLSLSLFASATAAATTTGAAASKLRAEENTDALMHEVVESLLQMPVKSDFTPDFLASRTMAEVIKAQTSRFRATVVGRLVESYQDSIVVCVDSDKLATVVAQTVRDEFAARGFTVGWSTANDMCQTQKGVYEDALLFTSLPVPMPKRKKI